MLNLKGDWIKKNISIRSHKTLSLVFDIGDLCYPAEKLYDDYVGAVQFENIFSINIGPDYEGKIRAIDVKTLQTVGEWIRDGK